MEEKEKARQEAEKAEREKEEAFERFRGQVRASHDLQDELPAFVDVLQEKTKATAVYIGKVVMPQKPIKDGDDDTAHIDPEAKPEIQFMYANGEHQFMVDKILKQE